jgi:hypothetical protein
MKSLLKAHCCSIINTTTPPEKAHRDSSNAIVKGCTVTLKKATRVVRTTYKSNQRKYHEVRISCLYLIKNKISFKTIKFKKE